MFIRPLRNLSKLVVANKSLSMGATSTSMSMTGTSHSSKERVSPINNGDLVGAFSKKGVDVTVMNALDTEVDENKVVSKVALSGPIPTLGMTSGSSARETAKRMASRSGGDLKRSDSHREKLSLLALAKKSGILTFVSVLTTLVFLGLAAFSPDAYALVGIDRAINGICLILMFRFHGGVYEKLFGRVEKCTEKMC